MALVISRVTVGLKAYLLLAHAELMVTAGKCLLSKLR